MVVVFVFNLGPRLGLRLSSSEIVTVSRTIGDGMGEDVVVDQELVMVTLLGFDGISAILSPAFATADEAEAWMSPDEPLLGLSFNGESRAYPINMLSRHEIVNDVVGGVPVAVTW